MSHVNVSQMLFLLHKLGFDKPAADEIIAGIINETGYEEISNDFFLFRCIKLLSEQNKELLNRVQRLESYYTKE